jgi:hypothetical protein
MKKQGSKHPDTGFKHTQTMWFPNSTPVSQMKVKDAITSNSAACTSLNQCHVRRAGRTKVSGADVATADTRVRGHTHVDLVVCVCVCVCVCSPALLFPLLISTTVHNRDQIFNRPHMSSKRVTLHHALSSDNEATKYQHSTLDAITSPFFTYRLQKVSDINRPSSR